MSAPIGSDETDDSSTLVQRFRSGDPAAGEALQKLHGASLRRFAFRYLGNEHSAEDAVQDAFARIFTSTTEPENFLAWARFITRNVCLNHLRDRGRNERERRLPTMCSVPADQTGALTRLARAEEGASIDDLLGRISESQREVLILRYLEGLEREEIAAALGVSLSVVKSRLYEAVSRLRLLHRGDDGG